MSNIEQILQNNDELICTWLHEISAYDTPEFNNAKMRFIKETLHQYHLLKLIGRMGWTNSTFKYSKTPDANDVIFCDSLYNTSTGHDLEIEGHKVSLKSGNNKIIGRDDRIKNTQGEASFLTSFDYLIQYSPAFSYKQPGTFGILTFDHIQKNIITKKDSMNIKTKDKIDYLFYKEYAFMMDVEVDKNKFKDIIDTFLEENYNAIKSKYICQLTF